MLNVQTIKHVERQAESDSQESYTQPAKMKRVYINLLIKDISIGKRNEKLVCFLFSASPHMPFGQPTPTEKVQGIRVLTATRFLNSSTTFVELLKIPNTA